MDSSTELLTVDFYDIDSMEYTRPVRVIYFGQELNASSWRSLYISLVKKLYREYPHVFSCGISFTGGRRIDVGSDALAEKMIKPVALSEGVFLETNLSASAFIKRIKMILRKCNVSFEDVTIGYEKKKDIGVSKVKCTEAPLGGKGVKIFDPRAVLSFCEQHCPEYRRLVSVLRTQYSNGIRFEGTAIRILEEKASMTVSDSDQYILKHAMFHRNDDLYFLTDFISLDLFQYVYDRSKLCAEIETFGCVDIRTIWDNYCRLEASGCLRDETDLEDFIKFILKDEVRIVNAMNTRILKLVGVTKNDALQKAAAKIVQTVTENGCITVEDLLAQNSGFTEDFVRRLLMEYSDDVLPCMLNDYLCYQTIEMMGVDETFSDVIGETLGKIKELHLSPSMDIIHALLSVNLGVNFRQEYNIPDDKTFRRVISFYCPKSIHRSWKAGGFVEACDENV